MVRVCQEWFPNKDPEKAGFYLDDRLKLQLDVLLKNIKNDWDFTILITGQGEVRVGKSMLAMQIGAYWTYEIWKRYGIKNPFTIKNNFCFEGKKLIVQGNYLGQNHPMSALVFDEAGSDLESKKVMQMTTQDVLDFYRECGQYNLLNILVLPDFFDLPRGLALTRSIFLLDVCYYADESGNFERGYYKFYSRRGKKWLYIKGKKNLDYFAVKSDFGKYDGRFRKFYPINEQEYRDSKVDALKRRESTRRNRFQIQRDAAIYLLCGEKQETTGKPLMNQVALSKRIEALTGSSLARQTISDVLKRFGAELGEEYPLEDEMKEAP